MKHLIILQRTEKVLGSSEKVKMSSIGTLQKIDLNPLPIKSNISMSKKRNIQQKAQPFKIQAKNKV